jgi:hypothetical protein
VDRDELNVFSEMMHLDIQMLCPVGTHLWQFAHSNVLRIVSNALQCTKAGIPSNVFQEKVTSSFHDLASSDHASRKLVDNHKISACFVLRVTVANHAQTIECFEA